jgi:phage terminase small subunit
MPTLTDRQERFIEEYLIDQNASAAAARAGYTARNMAAQGSELMNHPEIRERIRAAMRDVLAEIRASALDLMKKRVAAVYFDPIRLFRDGWEPMPVEEMDAETRALVEVRTVMRKSGPVTTVKQPDRDKALRALERFHEKLERLQEKEAERLWKAGLCLSLEEIEALDGGGVEAQENAEICQDLSGSADAVDPRFRGDDRDGVRDWEVIGEGEKVENAKVLSGCGDWLDARLRGHDGGGVRGTLALTWPREFFGNSQVLSGRGDELDPRFRGDDKQWRGGARENRESHQVLSGGEEMAGCAVAVG